MTPSDTNIPHGFCKCGCGQPTTIADYTWPLRGHVKGQHKDYVRGHGNVKPITIENAVPFKIDGECCRLIPLTRGLYTIVTATDYEWLMAWSWRALWNKNTNSYYASRWSRTSDRMGGNIVILMQRQILDLASDDPLNGDHINKNTLDNRRANLRPATASQSAMNRSLFKNNTSGVAGVHKSRYGTWEATIGVGGVHIYLGTRKSFEEACALRFAAQRKYHGEFSGS